MRSKLSISTAAAIIALLFMLAATRHAQAQGGSGGGPHRIIRCVPFCGGDTNSFPWQYPVVPFTAQVPDGLGCQFFNTCCHVTSWYRWRHVCFPPDDELQIEITSLSWDQECFPGQFFDPVPLLRVVIYGVLELNTMHFPPDITNPNDTTTCLNNYTVQAATCWKDEPGMKAAENCNVDSSGFACCKGGYQVCRATGPHGQYRQITWLGQSTVWNGCTPPCKPSCGAFNDDGIFNRKKDDPPSLSMTPVPADSVTAASATIEPKPSSTPQQR